MKISQAFPAKPQNEEHTRIAPRPKDTRLASEFLAREEGWGDHKSCKYCGRRCAPFSLDYTCLDCDGE